MCVILLKLFCLYILNVYNHILPILVNLKNLEDFFKMSKRNGQHDIDMRDDKP